jgi:hypothetical protein
MHLLQVLDGNENLHTRGTSRLFAAEEAHGNVLVGVWRVREPGDNVSWCQATLLAIDSFFVKVTGNHEDTLPGSQCGRDLGTAQS